MKSILLTLLVSAAAAAYNASDIAAKHARRTFTLATIDTEDFGNMYHELYLQYTFNSSVRHGITGYVEGIASELVNPIAGNSTTTPTNYNVSRSSIIWSYNNMTGALQVENPGDLTPEWHTFLSSNPNETFCMSITAPVERKDDEKLLPKTYYSIDLCDSPHAVVLSRQVNEYPAWVAYNLNKTLSYIDSNNSCMSYINTEQAATNVDHERISTKCYSSGDYYRAFFLKELPLEDSADNWTTNKY